MRFGLQVRTVSQRINLFGIEILKGSEWALVMIGNLLTPADVSLVQIKKR